MKRSKYRAIKTTIDGITFDSKKEAERYYHLKLMLRAGLILNLELQPTWTIEVNGIDVCKVKLDFKYFDQTLKKAIYEDVKGVDTPLSRLKRKMLEAQEEFKVTLIRR